MDKYLSGAHERQVVGVTWQSPGALTEPPFQSRSQALLVLRAIKKKKVILECHAKDQSYFGEDKLDENNIML